MKQRRNKFRDGVYIAGLVLEATNRLFKVVGRREPVKHGLIYGLYKIGKVLK